VNGLARKLDVSAGVTSLIRRVSIAWEMALNTYSLFRVAALRLGKGLQALRLVAHVAFKLDELVASTSEALRILGDLAHSRDLVADVGELLLAEVGCIAVPLAHVALKPQRKRDAPKPVACQHMN